jgi:hypothetical protein
MGGTYAFDLPFSAFTAASKEAGEDGVYTYTLTCNLPAQTGMGQETLHVTLKNGEIEGLHSDNAGIDMSKEEEITGWAALQNAINAGGVIKLAADVVAAADAALTIPANNTVVLDLNGHVINRNLSEAVENGSVIVNNGTLAIMGEGAIIGGNTTGNGGAIINNGTLTLYGGEITGNHAGGVGGGVYNSVTNTAMVGFWMTGGLIDNNTAAGYPAIAGDVTFNAQAVVQIDAEGTKVSIAEALAQLASLSYVKPIMPDYDDFVDPTLTVITWDKAFCENVQAGIPNEGSAVIHANNSKDGITATFVGNHQGEGFEGGAIYLAQSSSELIFTYESGDITKIEIFGTPAAETPAVCDGWTWVPAFTNVGKYVWEGTPDASVSMVGTGTSVLADAIFVAQITHIVFFVREKGAPTEVEDLNANSATNGRKVLRDGQILILRDGKTYTVTGQMVK